MPPKYYKNPLLWIIFFYLLTRTINLGSAPPFNDEAIYLDWGLRTLNLSVDPLLSLYDGKQPLLIWLFGITANFTNFPFTTGRLVSVIFGLANLFFIFKITKQITSEKRALLATIIYTLSPIFLFFDRQALMESAVTTIGLATTFCLLRLFRKIDTNSALFLAITWAVGLWIKSSTIIFIIPSFLTVSFFVPKHKLKLVFSLLLFSLLFSLILFLPILVHPNGTKIITASTHYFTNPENLLTGISTNFLALLQTVFVLGFGSTLLLLKNFKQNGIDKHSKLLLVSLFVYLLIFIFIAASPIPRYIAPLLFPLPILLAIVASKSNFSKIIFITTIIYCVSLNILFIFNPVHYFKLITKISPRFEQGYISSFTTGYGAVEAFEYIIDKSENKPTAILLRLDAGNPESTVQVLARKYPNITTYYIDKSDQSLLDKDQNYIVSTTPIYFITRAEHLEGFETLARLEKQFPNPTGDYYFSVYKINTREK